MEKIIGVTLDNIEKLTQILDLTSKIPTKLTFRVVFDENVKASYYKKPVAAIHEKAFVMGEILDSEYVKDISMAGYQIRTQEYLTALGNTVDIWEIGNEVNGEWLGNTANTVTKIKGAYDLVKAKGKKTAITLYYNEKCYEKKTNEMFTWAQKNILPLKMDLDYVFISYYEDDCNHAQPNWPAVFAKLAVMFPNSKIGFGECGTSIKSKKQEYMQRYYSTKINDPNWVGGFFWWYGAQDLLGKNTAMFETFKKIAGG